jgi:nucleoside-diphosphate-sugar epimerase
MCAHVYHCCAMHEIVDGIADALGKHPCPVRVPAWLAEDVYDTRRFEEAYGFQTKTSLEDGLKREVDWYRKQMLSTEY